jgi:hypothetical protein
MSEMLATLGDVLVRSLPHLNLLAAVVLMAALLADGLLARRVGAGLRALPYWLVLVRALAPLDWPHPLAALAAPWSQLFGKSFGAAALIWPARALVAGQPGAAGDEGPALWVGAAYLLGVGALGAWWLVRRRALARKLWTTRPAEGALAERVGGAPVFVHPFLGPLVAGVFQPRVIVPAALADDEGSLPMVLAHEAAHLSRRDALRLVAAQWITILAWPVLPVWIAAARLQALAELACDEWVLLRADAATRKAYARTLVACAGTSGRELLGPVPSWSGALAARVRALGFRRRWRPSFQLPIMMACLVGALAASARSTPAPRLILGPLSVRGALEESAIAEVMARHRDQLEACYGPALHRHQLPAGRALVLDWIINSRGEVVAGPGSDAAPESPATARCVGRVVRGWQFPQREGGSIVIVHCPLTLAAGGG